MKKNLILLLLAICIFACKKDGHSTDSSKTTAPLFTDVIVHEPMKFGNQSFQGSIGYFSLHSDPTTQIMVANRGRDLYGAVGFRIAGINRTNASVNWIKSYKLDDQYTIQYANCAGIDNNDNIWVGGISFLDTEVTSPFLVKLDQQGNILWSKSFRKFGQRASSLQVLRNGDIAFLVKSQVSMTLIRLSQDGQFLWSTMILYNQPVEIDYSYTVNNLLSPTNHMLTESGDGSLFFACTSNAPTLGVDRLVKIDKDGKFIFGKVYASGNTGTARAAQLIDIGDDRLLLADEKIGNNQLSPSFYFNLLSKDGQVLQARGNPLNYQSAGYNINGVNYFNNKIYLSTCGGYEFDTFILDLDLSLKSSVKSVYAADIGTERGGIGLFDDQNKVLYYILDFGGELGESNGFEIVRTDATGKPCIPYHDVATPFSMEDKSVSVTTDNDITLTPLGQPDMQPINWQSLPVSIVSTVNVCKE